MRIFIPLIIILLLFFSACSPVERTKEQPDEKKNEDDQQQETPEPTTISPPDGEKVLNQYKHTFMDIVDNASDTLEVDSFNTKNQLIKHFKKIMSEDLAKWYADTYFKEKKEHLFIIPKDAPVWLKSEQDFEQIKIADKKYLVVQERNNEMLGHVKMIYTLTYVNNNWIVEDIELKSLNSKGDINITDLEAELLVRKHLSLENEENVHVVFDHEEEDKFVIHVFDVVGEGENIHTATRGWYYVDKKTGEISNMMNE